MFRGNVSTLNIGLNAELKFTDTFFFVYLSMVTLPYLISPIDGDMISHFSLVSCNFYLRITLRVQNIRYLTLNRLARYAI